MEVAAAMIDDRGADISSCNCFSLQGDDGRQVRRTPRVSQRLWWSGSVLLLSGAGIRDAVRKGAWERAEGKRAARCRGQEISQPRYGPAASVAMIGGVQAVEFGPRGADQFQAAMQKGAAGGIGGAC